MLLLPALFVIVLCVALGLGKRKVGPFCYMLYGCGAQTVHARQTRQSSRDQTPFDSQAFQAPIIGFLCSFLFCSISDALLHSRLSQYFLSILVTVNAI